MTSSTHPCRSIGTADAAAVAMAATLAPALRQGRLKQVKQAVSGLSTPCFLSEEVVVPHVAIQAMERLAGLFDLTKGARA